MFTALPEYVEIGQLTAALGGVDTIIFTGGIGEHSIRVRKDVCNLLARWLPVTLSDDRNEANDSVIHDDASSIRILRIETDENGYMARAARQLIA